MRSNHLELWVSAATIAVIAAFYVSITAYGGVPAASGLLGHGLGILGFVLMLMTETLYSLRKKYQLARWGKLQNWLRFHIITGLVGPFLVLLHTSWKFQGLAGVLTLLTLVIVASGFIGRYFYTAIPRSPDGAILDTAQIEELLATTRKEIQSWQEQTLRADFSPPGDDPRAANRYSSASGAKQPGDPGQRTASLRELQVLQREQEKLHKQLANLAGARKLLALWHTIHVPIGLSLFLVAFVHIIAALYYATLLR